MLLVRRRIATHTFAFGVLRDLRDEPWFPVQFSHVSRDPEHTTQGKFKLDFRSCLVDLGREGAELHLFALTLADDESGRLAACRGTWLVTWGELS